MVSKEEQAAAAMEMASALAACPDDAQLVVPAWVLHALRLTVSGGGRPIRESHPLIPHHAKQVESMMAFGWRSELDGVVYDKTEIHQRAIELAQAIAAHCLCGHSADQIIQALQIAPELRRLVMAVRNGQEDWTF
jgi:hypothetical protein